MVLRVADWVLGRCGCKEVRRDQLGPLVDKLIKRVLTICARSTPDNRLNEFVHESNAALQKRFTEIVPLSDNRLVDHPS